MPEIRELRCLLAWSLLFSGAVAPAQASQRRALEDGNRALQAGKLEEAKNHFAGGFVEDPESAALHYSLGLAHLREGQAEKAGQYFLRASELAEKQGNPRLAAQARYNLGLCLSGETSAAVPDPSSAASAPSSAVLPRLRSAPSPDQPAPALSGQPPGGDLEGAMKAFRKAIELDPHDLDSKYNFLEIQRRLKEQQQQQQEQQDKKDQDEKDEDKKDPQDLDQSQQQKSKNGGQGQNQDQQPKNQDPNKDPQKGQGQGQKPPEQDPSKPDPDQQDPQDQDQPEKNQKQDPQQNQSGSENGKTSRGKGAPDQGGQSPGKPPEMDRQAMEQVLDALAQDEKEQMKRFLQNRIGPPKEVRNDW